MINLRPAGQVIAFPFTSSEQVAAAAGQLRNVFVTLAARHGADKARALFTEAACTELARQSGETTNVFAARFAVEVLLDQAYKRELGEAAPPIGFAG